MIAFLIVFLSVYTSMHAFVFMNVRLLFTDSRTLQGLCILFFAMMIVAPIGARLLERNGYDSLAQITAWIGYPWMGFIFLSVCAFFLRGVISVLSKLLSRFVGIGMPLIDGRASVVAVLGIVAIVSVYGVFEAQSVRVEHVEIKTAKLPAGVDHIKIAQISDVHIGLMLREQRLCRILEKVRLEDPDILVCTGDLVDGSYGKANHIPEIFDIIQPRYGKYAITGNHETYAGLDHSLESIRQFGFKLLRGEAVQVGDVLNVVGVDDPTVVASADEAALLASVGNGLFTLFLKHRPSVREESLGRFDLQLSGHTHRGQIFPFSFVTGLFYPMQDGLYELDKGSKLYTSRGSGTWGPPMRVLSPPEVTIIELTR
jgi:predicted MPP superfamily phosphohydrolase